jgi:hypothetical protein
VNIFIIDLLSSVKNHMYRLRRICEEVLSIDGICLVGGELSCWREFVGRKEE